MTEDDIRAVVRAVKASMAEEFKLINDKLDRLTVKMGLVEQHLAQLESFVHTAQTALEDSLLALETRVAALEGS